MISTSFAYGERSKIANAYTKMYAPKSLMNESCDCGKKGCTECGCNDGSAKKTKTSAKFTVKHKVPAKTGSKLGVRKVLPFEKRDDKSSAKKFTPKTKKVSESARYFCIADGDRVLCTNDIGESYFNKGGTCGDMRIYESKISAMKDISKVKARRNPNSKYKIRACECIGESVQFADSASGHQVNEGWFDAIGDTLGNVVGGVVDAGKGIAGGAANLGKGLTNAATGLIDNTVGKIPIVGDVTNAVTGGVRNMVGGTLDNANSLIGGVADAGNGLVQNFVGGGQQPQQQPAQQQVQQPQQQPAQQQAQQKLNAQAQPSQQPQQQPAQQQVQQKLNAQAQPSQQPQQQQAQQPQQQQAQPSQQNTLDNLTPKVNNRGPTANTPLTQAQINALNAGQGPVSRQTAEQIQQQKTSAPQGRLQGNNATRRAEYDQKRAALDKEYADVIK